ncbi:MAG: PAS domain S-box protein [Proteobacteria bacterium]|nr:PAS domain S-box protein [Pseudomonadota bacterium]
MNEQENQTTILLVEDEALLCMQGKSTLQKYGYKVITAPRGEKAIEIARTTPGIDLILMDVNLGKGRMDGTEAAEIILKERDIPVLFLSSYTQAEVVQKTEKITSYGYVVKDSGETVLIASIKMAFKLHEAHRRLKEREEELRDKEEEYRLLFESASSGVFIAQDGEMKITNPAVVEITGYPANRLTSEPFTSFIHPDDVGMVVDRYNKRLEGKTVKTNYPFRIVTAEGRVKWVDISSTFVLWKGRSATLNYIIDITSRKKAEEFLKESEEKFRLLFENSVDPILMIDGERFVDCNEAAVKIMHCTGKDQLVGTRPSDISPARQPDGRVSSEKEKELIGIALKQGSNHFEWKHRTVDGEEFWADVSLTVIPIQGRQIMYVVWRDITERINAQQKIIESEQSLHGILSSSPNGIGKVRDRVFEWVNDAMCRITGYAFDELKGASTRILYESDDEYERTGETLYREGRADAAFVTKDGIILNVIIQLSPTTSYSYIFTFTDITDRVQSEKEREALERRLSQLIDFLPDPTLAIDSEKRIIVWNRAMESLTGVPAADMMGKGDYAYTIPFYGVARPQTMDLFWVPEHEVAEKYPHITKEDDNYVIETFCPALFKGKGAHVWAKAAPLRDGNGHLVGAIEVVRDMTMYKQATDAIQDQLHFLQQLLDGIPNPVFYKNTQGVYLGCNNAYTVFTGLSKEEMIGKNVYDLFPRGRADIYREAEEGLLKSPGVIDYEISITDRDGMMRHIVHNKASYVGLDGQLAGIVGVIFDITSRRQAEDALKEKEARYHSLSNMLQLMCDNVPDMIWAKDLDKRYIFANKAICRDLLNAADTDEPIGKNDMFFAERERTRHVDNPEWHTFNEICRDTDVITMDAGKQLQFDEHGNVQGKYLFLDVRKTPFIDENGTMIGTVGSARDVTAVKEMEKELKKSEEKYRSIFENAIEGIFQTTPEGQFLTVNTKLARIFGFSSQEEVMEAITDIGRQLYVNPDERDEFIRIIQEKGVVRDFELQMRRKDGSIFWSALNYRSVYDESGKLLYYEGTCEDITDRKLAEEEIQNLLSEKELLLREVHHRIKNNMGVVVSLLSLQSNTLHDPAAVAALEDSGNRVRNMMVLYDKLYRSTDFREISAKEYLTSLIDEIVINFPNRGLVTIEKQIDDVTLDAKTLSPLGMILNELLTNSMKHAFTGRENGKISVSLSFKDNHATLIIQDNGVGIPESIDITASTGFGMQLVGILTEQLEGSMKIERAMGMKFILEFAI